ncbi:hypothetical protein [Clostridium paraputrificum]|jgi:hypothetical protein|uniref:hypothetical protein n=1 Tax=Clostridium paraputrificum TaxID=29363 RepID=UPI002053BEC6|nr:MAG TPA_asm: hypothetical protein [Caudoviricetes sp.]
MLEKLDEYLEDKTIKKIITKKLTEGFEKVQEKIEREYRSRDDLKNFSAFNVEKKRVNLRIKALSSSYYAIIPSICIMIVSIFASVLFSKEDVIGDIWNLLVLFVFVGSTVFIISKSSIYAQYELLCYYIAHDILEVLEKEYFPENFSEYNYKKDIKDIKEFLGIKEF